jgi:hypothetical protein
MLWRFREFRLVALSKTLAASAILSGHRAGHTGAISRALAVSGRPVVMGLPYDFESVNLAVMIGRESLARSLLVLR